MGRAVERAEWIDARSLGSSQPAKPYTRSGAQETYFEQFNPPDLLHFCEFSLWFSASPGVDLGGVHLFCVLNVRR